MQHTKIERNHKASLFFSFKRSLSMLLMICVLISIASPVLAAGQASSSTDKLSEQEWNNFGFTYVNKQYLNEEQAWAYQYKHRSGAQLVHIDNESKNKTFSIGFKTPPIDDKGANHVLEHALLSGSEKYPSRNILNNLVGSSVASLMNAFTADDYTVYPFTTRNQKDYENLADVYLDAVFHPRILKDENLFRLQGIRQEYRDGKVQYNGIVYNELKGESNSYGDMSYFLMDELYKDLYKGTSMGNTSTGSIASLEQLTYNEVIRVYQTYYKPSNALVYLSGKQDLKWTLSKINSYFAEYSPEQVNISFTNQPNQPKQTVYASMPGEQAMNSYGAGVLFAGPAKKDAMAVKAMEVLFSMAMEDMSDNYDGLMTVGGNAGGIVTQGILLPVVSAAEKDEFISDYMNIFKKYAQEGLDRKKLDQKMNETDYKGDLMSVTSAMEGYAYANNPLLYLDTMSIYEDLKKPEAASYLAEILDRYFINNPYKSVVIASRTGKDEASSKQTSSQVYTSEQLAVIKQQSKAFDQWMAKPESKEVLAKNPTLDLSNFQEDSIDITVNQEMVKGVLYFHTDTDTKGEIKVFMGFDLSVLNEKQIPQVKLLADLYSQYLQEQNRNDIQLYMNAYGDRYDQTAYRPVLMLHVKGKENKIKEKLDALMSLINNQDVLDAAKGPERLKKIEQSVRFNVIDQASNYEYAISSLSAANRFNALASGAGGKGSLAYLKFVQNLNSSVQNQKAELKALAEIKDKVFNINGLAVEIQGNVQEYQKGKTVVSSVTAGLSKKMYSKQKTKLPAGTNSAAILTLEGQQNVAAVIQVGNLAEFGVRSNKNIEVLQKYLVGTYLMQSMRDLGAYGGGMIISGDRGVILSAGRAPDVKKVLGVFQGVGRFLKKPDLSQKELDSYIIAAVNEFDSMYQADDGHLWVFGLEMYYSNFTIEDLKRERQEILATTVQDIKAYAPALERMVAQNKLFIKANQSMIKKSGLTFKDTIDLGALKNKKS